VSHHILRRPDLTGRALLSEIHFLTFAMVRALTDGSSRSTLLKVIMLRSISFATLFLESFLLAISLVINDESCEAAKRSIIAHSGAVGLPNPTAAG